MTLRYMLDTDTVSFAFRGQGGAGARLLEHKPSECCISAITLAELRYGAELRRSKKLHRLIDTFTATIAAVPFEAPAADRFGIVAAALARRGTPVGPLDTAIAAHALSLGLTLVTNNVKHFRRVARLRVENWVSRGFI